MLDEFFENYIEAALWSTNDESDESGGDPLDDNYDDTDIDPGTLASLKLECEAFLIEAEPLILEAEELIERGEWKLPDGSNYSVVAYAGHDFWLTRNEHGCGYWDGDWPDKIGEALTALSEKFDVINLCVGDDGKIYS